MFRKVLIASIGLSALGAGPAAAHFQLVYTPDVLMASPAAPVKLIFWHPMSLGFAMDMGQPLEFFHVHNGQRTDLLSQLRPISFDSTVNVAAAYEANLFLPAPGDYVLALVPAPYYEAAEDIYIQQITKSFVNRGGLPTDWSSEIGLPAEIVPLNNPTNILVGSTFTGRVLSGGAPVAGAEIEIEYIAAVPDIASNVATMPPTVGEPPGGVISAISDANGYFTFGVPRAGFWGFAALDIGPDTEHEGKHLSQDAVIWIRAWDF